MQQPRFSRSLTTNVFSISASRAWQAGLQFIFTPVYITLLGPDAYGIIALNATLLLALLCLDQLVNPLLIREIGRLANKSGAAPEIRNLLRSLECVSLVTGIAVGLAIVLAAPVLVGYWITASTLSDEQVTTALRLIGVSIACQWPGFLYGGGFIGLHRQDVLGAIRVIFATLQTVGGVLLLWLVSPSIMLLLLWQIATFAAQSVVLNRAVWRALPPDPRPPRFDLAKLRSVWRFGAGTLVVAAATSLLTHGDKLIVSKLVTLDQFSAYFISSFVGLYLTFLVIWPVTHSLQAHFARLIEQNDEALLAREYHRWTQLVSIVVLAVFGPIIVYAQPLLLIWLGPKSPVVEPAAQYLSWFMLGYIFNNVVSMALILQIAAGYVRLSVIKNVLAAVLFVPAVYVGILHYGPVAGAVCWFVFNVGYFVLEIPMMHRRLLRRELWEWWAFDTCLPMGIAAAILWISARLSPPGSGVWGELALAAATSACIAVVLTVALPHARAQALRSLKIVKSA